MTFTAFDPTTGQALQPAFKSATAAQVDAAAQRAAAAFRDFACSSGEQRARLLEAIAAGIEALGPRLIDTVTRETALPAARVTNERARTCLQLRMFAALARQDVWSDERIDPAEPGRQPPRPRIRCRLRPMGPVVIFGASNFPLAFSVAGGDTASALAVGCPVLFKAHPAHPGTSTMIGAVIDSAVTECGLHEGVFSLLFDAGHEVGLALLRHPLIKAGSFTGSSRGGLALLRAAQDRPEPIPFFAEMGSVNPVFLLPQAVQVRSTELAAGLHASITLGCGQFCTQPGLIFVVDSVATQVFLQALGDAIAATPPGAMLTSGMCSAYEAALKARASIPGVRVLAHGVAAPQDLSHRVAAAVFTTDATVFLNSPVLAEEAFGPGSLIVLCKSTADLQRCAERLQGQLTATVWAEREELAGYQDLVWTLEQKAGRIVFNGYPTGVEVGPATMHGGPFPAASDSRFTSVGARALLRFVRPVAWQGELL